MLHLPQPHFDVVDLGILILLIVDLGNLQWEEPRSNPDHMTYPPQLIPFDVEKQWLYSKIPPDDQALQLFSKSKPGHPMDESYFSCLYLGSPSFGHDYDRW